MPWLPPPNTTHPCLLTCQRHRYEEELAAEEAIVEKDKERYQEAKEEIDRIHKQAQKREDDLQKQLDARMTKYTQALQDMEVKAATTLLAANSTNWKHKAWPLFKLPTLYQLPNYTR